jgi:flagellar assembly protein FliH
LSSSARHHLRDARRADAVTFDADGRLVTSAETELDELAAAATAEGEDILAEARRRAELLVHEASIEAASIRHDAYAEGRERGERDGVALARAELADQMALLQRAAAESKSIRDRLLWAAEQEIVELVLQATRTVVGEHARLDPSLAVDTVERALQRAGSQNVVSIRVHPDRQELIEAHVSELHGQPRPFEVRADDSVAIGGCVIDTATGQVDARLDVQLDEIARLLREALPTAEAEDEWELAA